MRIAFVGNQDNNAYRLCKWVRHRGLDAHLYMIRQEWGSRSHPELIDVELQDGYPDWIRQYDDRSRIWFLRRSEVAARIEREYDIVVASGVTGLLTARHFRRLPVVLLVLGSELSQLPMERFKRGIRLRWRLVGHVLRRNLRRVSKIVTLGFWPEMQALAQMRLLDRTAIWGFPEDIEQNRFRVKQELLDELNRKYGEYDRVFIWLSRLNFTDPTSLEYKGPDIFLEAFGRIVSEMRYHVRAVIGDHGLDRDVFRTLVKEKQLTRYVDFVPHLPVWELLTYASVANAVMVDVPALKVGHVFGGLAREAMSVGAALITGWDKELVDICYGPGCPALGAYDVATCHEAMTTVSQMGDEEFRRLQQATSDWAGACLHHETHVARLLDLLQEVLYCHRFARPGRA